jgi:hypothetical protein
MVKEACEIKQPMVRLAATTRSGRTGHSCPPAAAMCSRRRTCMCTDKQSNCRNGKAGARAAREKLKELAHGARLPEMGQRAPGLAAVA